MSRITSIADCRSINEGDILSKEPNSLTYTVGRNDGQIVYLQPIGMSEILGDYQIRTGYLQKTYESLISEGHWLHYKENQISEGSVIYHGQSYAESAKKFDDLLDEIERRHLDYLEPRGSMVGNQYQTLKESLSYGIVSGKLVLNKNPAYDLPENIFRECVTAFLSVFKEE